MQTVRIIAVRHGETAWNADGRVQGHTDVALSAAGRAQAALLADALAQQHDAIDALCSSDLLRARQTAQAVQAATGAPLVLEPRLRERAFGQIEGLSFAQVQARWPADAEKWRKRDLYWAAPGGESLLRFQERVIGAIQDLAQRHLGQQIAIITHGGVLDVLYRAATGCGLQGARTWQLGNCAINRLLWTPGGQLALVGWADDQHLQQRAIDETTS
ncbi:MAG: histidine phosphatase family protein [Burkholderiaceae bacterium]|nr:histidine phosphatase family protein [Burkholderiaceae bacterium]